MFCSDWHFDFLEGCYPTAAFWNGQKTPPGGVTYPNGPSNAPVYTGCAPYRAGDQAHDFPTYYLVRKCQYDNGYEEYHVMYSAFFPYASSIQPHAHQLDVGEVLIPRHRAQTSSAAATFTTGNGPSSSGSASPKTTTTGAAKASSSLHMGRPLSGKGITSPTRSMKGKTLLSPLQT